MRPQQMVPSALVERHAGCDMSAHPIVDAPVEERVGPSDTGISSL